jgi:predicted AAA+ superfamily ATPase
MQLPRFGRYLTGPLGARAPLGKARLVLGARQTGKSTLFRMLLRPTDLLIDLQERSERLRFSREPEALSRQILAAPRVRHVMIDEVQRVPELLDEVQLILDRAQRRVSFTLTGGSARRLRRGPHNLLPGRVHRFSLGPVCAWEVAGGAASRVLPPPRRRGRVARAFPARALEDVLVSGSLPGAFTEGGGFRRTLTSYGEAYIEEEVLREMAARNLGQYGRFLELAAAESGRAINLTKIGQESGIALSTLRGFYGVLEDTLLGFGVPAYARADRARLLTTPRFYFFDVGVRNAVARLPIERGILATEAGALFEHWVACELTTRIGYLGPGYRLSYWRTVDGAEVDFILETPRETLPIEAKFTARPRPTDASGIERFMRRYPGRARRGFVVCRVARPEQISRHVLAIPWTEL